MYEASFGLKRRPFAATPDATCFLSAGPIQAALDEIIICIEQGQGIAVLTAPAGVGKTLLCEKLESELNPRFQTVFLRHASFLTRRALLQTLLCELNHPYQQPSEQELRLELFPAIRALHAEREALVIICDEAHQLSESLIEELRILADFAESGRPLVRLVLAGQLSLEEKLAQPGLEAFNQRIRAHVNLPTFDRAGSLDYIDYRLTWGGGRTDEIFTPEALEVIVKASDGIPRCLNQLADHSLLLAYVAEQKSVSEENVLEALNDLRQLPLQWNESSLSRSSFASHESDSVSPDSIKETDVFTEQKSPSPMATGDSNVVESPRNHGETVEVHSGTVSFEIGADLETTAPESSQLMEDIPDSTEAFEVTFESPDQLDHIEIDATSEDWRQTIHLFSVSRNETEVPVAAAPVAERIESFQEEFVVDRYATIDAGYPPIHSSVPDTVLTIQVREVHVGVESPVQRASVNQGELDDFTELDTDLDVIPSQRVESQSQQTEILKALLGDVRDLIEVVSDAVAPGTTESKVETASPVTGTVRLDPPHEVSSTKANSDNDQVILKSLCSEDDHQSDFDPAESASEIGHNPHVAAWEAIETTPLEQTEKPRPYRYLFSMLRRKQQQSH